MALKLTYPSWADWLTGVEAALKAALKQTGLTSYRINGARTNLKVGVKSADQHLGHQPYVEVVLAAVQNGWDDMNSGQLDYDSFEYTSIGDSKLVRKLAPVRERITFQVDIYAQKHQEALVIAQTIRRHFNAFGELQITWQGQDCPVFTKLHDFSMEAVETSRDGKVENFRASWLLTLSIISEQSRPDIVVKAIEEVITDVTDTQGGSIEHESTKTIS